MSGGEPAEVGAASDPADAIERRRFLRAFLGAAGVACLLLATLNWVVNPYEYYPSKRFRPLVWSSRSLKVGLMRRAQPPGVVILGSSRSMALDPALVEVLTGRSAFNMAVDSARTEDYLALLRFALEELGWRPSELVIGIDLEAFRDHLDPDLRLLSNVELRRFLPPEMRWWGFWRRAQWLVSLDQALASGRAVGLARRGFPPDPKEFGANGLLHDVALDREIAKGTFRLDVRGSVSEYVGRYAGFTALDPRRCALFEEVLRLAAERGIRVRAFATPLHPAVLAELRRQRDFDRLHGLLTAYLGGLVARTPGFSYRDLTEIRSFGGDEEDFYDGAHMRRKNSERVVRAIFAD